MTADWAVLVRQRMDRHRPRLDPGLVEHGAALLESLPRTATHTVVLHGDINPGNILAAHREPWLAIDPKPMVGDPAYDPAPLLAQVSPTRGPSDPRPGLSHLRPGLSHLRSGLSEPVFGRSGPVSAPAPGPSRPPGPSTTASAPTHPARGPAGIERRYRLFADMVGQPPERLLAWAVARAVESALWRVDRGDLADARADMAEAAVLARLAGL